MMEPWGSCSRSKKSWARTARPWRCGPSPGLPSLTNVLPTSRTRQNRGRRLIDHRRILVLYARSRGIAPSCRELGCACALPPMPTSREQAQDKAAPAPAPAPNQITIPLGGSGRVTITVEVDGQAPQTPDRLQSGHTSIRLIKSGAGQSVSGNPGVVSGRERAMESSLPRNPPLYSSTSRPITRSIIMSQATSP